MATEHRTVRANGISIHVALAGPESSPPVVLLHGFPDFWYTWRYQMASLASRGYRCIAPDLRGYGGTDTPSSPAAYTAFHVVGDLVSLIDALALDKVFVVGHDWGAIIAWYFCLFRPDRVLALVNLSVAYMRRSSRVTFVEYYRRAYGDDFYICRFQKPGVAEEEFSSVDLRDFFKKVLTGHTTSSTTLSHQMLKSVGRRPSPLPSWLSEEDVDYYASTFKRTGFTGGFNYYRCFDVNWELTATWANAQVKVPTKFIVGDKDLTYDQPGIRRYIHGGKFKRDVPMLEEVVVVEGAGHFLQQERAEEITDHIYHFIRKYRAGVIPSSL